MDPFTVLGAVSGASQPAGQLMTCTIQLCQLLDRVKRSPKFLEDLHNKSRLMATTLQQIPERLSQSFRESLQYASDVLTKLEITIKQFKEGLENAGSQVALYWARLVVVLKGDKLKGLVEKLASARSQLRFDISTHIAAEQATKEDIARLVKAIALHSHLPYDETINSFREPVSFSILQERRIVELDDEGEEKLQDEVASTGVESRSAVNNTSILQNQAPLRKRLSTKTKSYQRPPGRYQKVSTRYAIAREGSHGKYEEIEEETIFVPSKLLRKLAVRGYWKMKQNAGGH